MCIRDRNKNGSFCCLADLESFSPAELIALIRELQRQIEELRRENEELRRRQGRSAAPFSKGAGKRIRSHRGARLVRACFCGAKIPWGKTERRSRSQWRQSVVRTVAARWNRAGPRQHPSQIWWKCPSRWCGATKWRYAAAGNADARCGADTRTLRPHCRQRH